MEEDTEFPIEQLARMNPGSWQELADAAWLLSKNYTHFGRIGADAVIPLMLHKASADIGQLIRIRTQIIPLCRELVKASDFRGVADTIRFGAAAAALDKRKGTFNKDAPLKNRIRNVQRKIIGIFAAGDLINDFVVAARELTIGQMFPEEEGIAENRIMRLLGRTMDGEAKNLIHAASAAMHPEGMEDGGMEEEITAMDIIHVMSREFHLRLDDPIIFTPKPETIIKIVEDELRFLPDSVRETLRENLEKKPQAPAP